MSDPVALKILVPRGEIAELEWLMNCTSGSTVASSFEMHRFTNVPHQDEVSDSLR